MKIIKHYGNSSDVRDKIKEISQFILFSENKLSLGKSFTIIFFKKNIISDRFEYNSICNSRGPAFFNPYYKTWYVGDIAIQNCKKNESL